MASLAAVAHAHFKLAFPDARGVFSEDDEGIFCNNYANAASNRTVFPLNDGVIMLYIGHPQWTLGVEISTVQNPNSFDNFTSNGKEQLARQFTSGTGEGDFCIPLPLNDTGIPGVTDGANVTIQIVFDGGDDKLYQCADLTLSSTATIPSEITCQNGTTSSSTSNSSNSDGATNSSSTGGSAATLDATISSSLIAAALLLAVVSAALV